MSTGTASSHDLTPELRALQAETEGHARAFGLDFYDTIFEVLDYDELKGIDNSEHRLF